MSSDPSLKAGIKGELVYNCTRCGAVLKHPYSDIWEALNAAARSEIRNLFFHQCSEVQVGMTQLIGANILR